MVGGQWWKGSCGLGSAPRVRLSLSFISRTLTISARAQRDQSTKLWYFSGTGTSCEEPSVFTIEK